jgi:colanic acid biosynthesis glycosyl transferase WcaI
MIIFVNRYFYPDLSATSQMLSDLACALAGDGSRVLVVTSRQTYEDPEARLPARQAQGGVEIHRVWTTRFGRMNLLGRVLDYASFYVAAFLMLLRNVKPGDVIIAKTDPPLISVIAWIAAKTKGAKLINWLQDVFPEVAVALGVLTWQPLVGLTRWLRNLSLRGAEMNVVLGERMQEHICAQGVARARIIVIHNWANGSLIKPVLRASNSLRDAWNLQDKYVVGYSGNMGRAHEFDTIIRAMQRLQRKNLNIVFLFIGGGAGRAQVERAVSELGLRNCLFQPYQPRERLSESLSAPDVHLVSLQPQLEGLIVPSKIYGIAAAGRPVIFIGDPDGEVARLISGCNFGFSVPVGADEQLVEQIDKLVSEPDLARRLGNNARRSFEDSFDFGVACLKWKRLLMTYQ